MTVKRRNPDLGARIRAGLNARGMSVSDLADNANLSREQIHRLINGYHYSPHASSLYDIAKALGTTMEALLGRERLTEANAGSEV